MERPVPDNRPLFVRKTRTDYRTAVPELLDAAGLAAMLEGRQRVLIKPNLVGTHAPPVTTPASLVEAIADYVIEKSPGAEVIIGDGTGSLEYDTFKCFSELGFETLAEAKPVRLTDLNDEPLVRLADERLAGMPEFYIPELVMESFLISVPVLKAHTLAGVTLTMKNMIGVAPPVHYQAGGRWKKSIFHERMHESIFEVNCYRTPDFTVLDATQGMKEAHLWGDKLDPAPELLVAGCDPVAVDAFGAGLLGRDLKDITHITMADGVLGRTTPSKVVRL